MTETAAPRLLSVNVGLPQDIAWRGETVHTAVWKRAVAGPRMVRRLNLDGDGQGDLIGHGGEQRAILVYQIDCYRYWERELARNDFDCGQFGENFTVDGLPDDEVCIGDRYRIGSALFEVTQPRVTCYRIGIRMNERRMAALLVSHGRPGFYFRVIEEGEVEAGDEIIKLVSGAERMSVAKASALLYLPGHRREELQRALRIPALSAGWKDSFRALLEQSLGGGTASGNRGLAPSNVSLSPPAWRGFRPMRIAAKVRESTDVISLVLEPVDARSLATPLAGQFIVLRLLPQRETSPLMRSYSLSGAPNAARYRVSIKCETAGAVGAYLDREVGLGDTLEVSAPRGSFTLEPGERPLVLASAGIGITPVLAILHGLAAEPSAREIWWLYGARNGKHHPFALESRALLRLLPHGRSRIWYSRATAEDRLGTDFDAAGHLTVASFDALKVFARRRFLPVRSSRVHARALHRSRRLGRSAHAHSYRNFWLVRIPHAGHRRFASSTRALTRRARGERAARVVCAQQSLGSLASEVSEPVGTCRSLRRSRPMVVPHRGVPHLRERTRGWSRRLSAGSARVSRRWQRADLLLATRQRRGYRPLSGITSSRECLTSVVEIC
jgi:MOSC domain-containing protein YiiM/ferredoxin-NADP reductase